jgi:hypothetical protein
MGYALVSFSLGLTKRLSLAVMGLCISLCLNWDTNHSSTFNSLVNVIDTIAITLDEQITHLFVRILIINVL